MIKEETRSPEAVPYGNMTNIHDYVSPSLPPKEIMVVYSGDYTLVKCEYPDILRTAGHNVCIGICSWRPKEYDGPSVREGACGNQVILSSG